MIEICGIPYRVIECADKFDTDAKHFGQVDFLKAEIRVNKDMAEAVKAETITHEIMHAIAVARHFLGEDCTMEEIWKWAEGGGNNEEETLTPDGV